MIEDSNGHKIAYVSIDNGMVSQMLRTRVIERLSDKFGKDVFNASNVMITGKLLTAI